MNIPRRKFLKLLVTSIGGGLIGYGAFRYLTFRFPDEIWSLSDGLTSPALDYAPPGPLSEPVLQILIVTVHTLIDASVEITHYEDYFRWHSENLSGYKSLYEQFALDLNQTANKSSGCDFIECEAATRYTLLAKAFEVRDAVNRINKLRSGIFEREWLRYDKYIIREIFSLFAQTDALILLGYDAWPGIPRTLDKYTQPPSKISAKELE